ncbi:zinc-finger homeodomain protein 3-like [Prosopis cineraria]|uniref:zinc-finger homeodomain protein 3-like n=1 Tax=Prosopis cineraria TaxID=364024 RepID=UPI00240EEA72|nr:zinc-finger homeodomain protein 3-like [Prosopis cineraria]
MSDININVSATYKQEVIYKECLHNHAASLGLVANDGCYEFLKPNTNNTVDGDPQHEFLCAVCKCHRNFHRKEVIYTPIMQILHHHQQPTFRQDVEDRQQMSMLTITTTSQDGGRGRRGTMFTARATEPNGGFSLKGISRRMFIVWVNNNRRRMNQDQAAAAAVAV